jgi:hypothetical protein
MADKAMPWDRMSLPRADVDAALAWLEIANTPLSRAWVTALAWHVWHRLSTWGLWGLVHGFDSSRGQYTIDSRKVTGRLTRDLQRWQLASADGALTPFGLLVRRLAWPESPAARSGRARA